MNRSLIQSAGLHAVVLGLLVGPSLFRSPPVMWIDSFDMTPGSGGGGGGGKGGSKEKELGQVVPKPEKVAVPAKPAPLQKEIKAEESWKVKNAKETKKQEPEKVQTEAAPVERGEKTQKAQSNIIHRGKSEGETAGDGGFDFGEGGGSGGGAGAGIGIGTGSGSGGGFGFGSYLGLLRQRIWQEWTQSAVYGSQRSCVVALTVSKSGMVSNISLEKTSGNSFYDNVALRAVRNSSPLPPLPANFPSSEQRFRIQFKLQE
jgi:TolA protein